ncbi:MAG: insulinase family protein, partial [Halieaceae bacterium]|nr:insulinase family protein [Halieaceae bacterium]
GHLEEALDRFAQFFIAPRFDAEYVDREVNAVNAEYQMGLNTDARRNLDVARETVNPEHPYSVLGVGTSDTLADRPGHAVRDDLLKFYAEYYSANLMTLAVLGSESLDELEAMVRDIFAPVPNHQVSIEDIEAPLYTPEQLPQLVYIQPQASARSLTVAFPIPNLTDRYRAKPLMYIGNLIGHEGEGSLLSLLKEEGWAEALGAGSGINYRGGAAFQVSVNLTEAGLAERDQVVRKLFEYIQMLREEGPQRELYREQAQLAALAFRFREEAEPLGYVAGLANDMHTLAPRDVLSGNYLMEDYQPALIEELLNEYFVPGNAVITVMAPDLPVDRASEFYGTPYSVRTLDLAATGWDNIQTVDARLHLPAANEFIADNVELLPASDEGGETPALVVDDPRLRVWFLQDTIYQVPRGNLLANFLTAEVNGTVEQAAASELYVALLRDAVNEYTYPAFLAGLNFGIAANSRGIGLTVSGYNDKQLVLLERIVESIVAARLDNGRFDNIRSDLVRSYENVKTAPAFRQVSSDARRLLLTGRFREQDMIAALQALTPEAVAAHAETLWNSSRVDLLMNGNYSRKDVDTATRVLAPLMQQELALSAPAPRIVRLAAGEDLVYSAEVEHEDSVLFWYLQAPDDSIRSRALAGLTGQAISADFFEELRTERQLGYVVSAFPWPLLDVPAVAMMVQSPSASATAVREESRAFLERQVGENGVSAERFQRHQAALLKDVLRPHKNLAEQSQYFWREIARGQFQFDGREQLADAVEDIEYNEWLDWYRQVILDDPASLVLAAPGRWGEVPEGTRVASDAELQASRAFYQRH